MPSPHFDKIVKRTQAVHITQSTLEQHPSLEILDILTPTTSHEKVTSIVEWIYEKSEKYGKETKKMLDQSENEENEEAAKAAVSNELMIRPTSNQIKSLLFNYCVMYIYQNSKLDFSVGDSPIQKVSWGKDSELDCPCIKNALHGNNILVLHMVDGTHQLVITCFRKNINTSLYTSAFESVIPVLVAHMDCVSNLEDELPLTIFTTTKNQPKFVISDIGIQYTITHYGWDDLCSPEMKAIIKAVLLKDFIISHDCYWVNTKSYYETVGKEIQDKKKISEERRILREEKKKNSEKNGGNTNSRKKGSKTKKVSEPKMRSNWVEQVFFEICDCPNNNQEVSVSDLLPIFEKIHIRSRRGNSKYVNEKKNPEQFLRLTLDYLTKNNVYGPLEEDCEAFLTYEEDKDVYSWKDPFPYFGRRDNWRYSITMLKLFRQIVGRYPECSDTVNSFTCELWLARTVILDHLENKTVVKGYRRSPDLEDRTEDLEEYLIGLDTDTLSTNPHLLDQ